MSKKSQAAREQSSPGPSTSTNAPVGSMAWAVQLHAVMQQHASTCDNMKELVYLHEVWPQVREWEAVKKVRLA